MWHTLTLPNDVYILYTPWSGAYKKYTLTKDDPAMMNLKYKKRIH